MLFYLLGTPKNNIRHSELVSESPVFVEIDYVELRFASVAGQARNDESVIN